MGDPLATLHELACIAAMPHPFAGDEGDDRKSRSDECYESLADDPDLGPVASDMLALCHGRHTPGSDRARRLDTIRRDHAHVLEVVGDWYREQHDHAEPPWWQMLTVQAWQAAKPTGRSRWRERLAPIIARTLAEHGHRPEREVRQALRDAWERAGLGPRAHHPYKVWLTEVRRQMALMHGPLIGGRHG